MAVLIAELTTARKPESVAPVATHTSYGTVQSEQTYISPATGVMASNCAFVLIPGRNAAAASRMRNPAAVNALFVDPLPNDPVPPKNPLAVMLEETVDMVPFPPVRVTEAGVIALPLGLGGVRLPPPAQAVEVRKSRAIVFSISR